MKLSTIQQHGTLEIEVDSQIFYLSNIMKKSGYTIPWVVPTLKTQFQPLEDIYNKVEAEDKTHLDWRAVISDGYTIANRLGLKKAAESLVFMV